VKLEVHFNKIHMAIEKDLNKAYELSTQIITQKGHSGKEINKIFPFLLSFDQLIFQSKKQFKIKFGLKSEFDLLTEFLNKTQDQGFDTNILNLIKRRLMSLEKASFNQRFAQIGILKHLLSEKVKGYFKVKRKLVDFNRPKINEVVKIGSSKVFLEIFFDKDISNKEIANLLESHLNIMSITLDKTLRQSLDRVLAGIKQRIDTKARFLQNKNLTTIQKIWLDELKDMLIAMLKQNRDLMLTPNFRYQVKITKNTGGGAMCMGLSRVDHYLLGLNISTLIIFYLTCENFYHSIPAALFAWFAAKIPEKIEQTKKMPGFNYYAVDKALNRIQEMTQSYRTWSLYSTFCHETEHAFDRKFLSKLAQLQPLLTHLIRESGFYKNHKTLNLSPGLMALCGFFRICRTEAPSQFREFIVNHKNNVRQNEFYSLVNPIPALGSRNLVQDMNKVLRECENESKSDERILHKGYDIEGFGYAFSHFMNMIIFLADCKKRNLKLVMLESHALNKMFTLFREAMPILTGHTGINKIKQGSPEWFLLHSVIRGTNNQFAEILRRNNIGILTLADIPSVLQQNVPFHIFKPPVRIMKITLRKIQKSDEITYFRMYEQACNILGIPENERLLSIEKFKEFAEKLYQANAILAKKSGFHS